MYAVEDRTVGGVEQVNRQVQLVYSLFVLVACDISLALQSTHLLILDTFAIYHFLELRGLIWPAYRCWIHPKCDSHSLLVLLLVLVEDEHLIVVVFLGEEHVGVLLVVACPELVRLLQKLAIRALVVLVVEL